MKRVIWRPLGLPDRKDEEERAYMAQALGELLRSRPTITATVEQVLEGGDIALVVNAWAMTATAPDGSVLRRDGRSTDVVRRQPDGTWLVAIDKP